MTTICDLNDDCLVQIVGFLQFHDQAALRQATKHGTRLHSAVETTWRHVKLVNVANICDWNQIKMLSDRFPSLNTLILDCDINGEFVANWTQLQELDLHLYKPEMKYIGEICKNLKSLKKLGLSAFPCDVEYATASLITLDQLTELKLEIDAIKKVHIRRLMIGLPQLRKLLLSSSPEDVYIEEIAKIRGQEVVTASFKELESVRTVTLLKLPNLRRLKIIFNDGNLEFETFAFRKPLSRLPGLKNIHLSINWESFDTLWELFAMAPHLKVLNVYVDNCKRALEGRKEPLTLHINDYSHSWCWNPLKIFRKRNLKVSLEEETDDDIEDIFEEDLFGIEF